MPETHTRDYRIGQAAALAGTTPDTLRYYERQRLLARAPRTNGGFRRYGAGDLERLQFIRRAQAVGLSLGEIRLLVGLNGQEQGAKRCRQVRELLTAKLAQTDERLTELRAFRRTLAASLKRCAEAVEAGRDECPVVDHGKPKTAPAPAWARGRR